MLPNDGFEELKEKNVFDQVKEIKVDLYGSLSLTGKGHATDIASILGLCGFDPVTMDLTQLDEIIETITSFKRLELNGEKQIEFDPETQVILIKTS